MRGTVPLFENVLVAALAGIRLHEELRGDFPLPCHLRRTRKEGSIGAVAFVVHRHWSDRWILDDEALAPGIARILRPEGDDHCDGDHSQRRNPSAMVLVLTLAEPPSRQQRYRHRRNRAVRQQQLGIWPGRTGVD